MNKPFLSRRHALTWAAASIAGLGTTAHAQGETLRLIVPFAAGSTIDAVARMVGQRIQELTKQVVVVDNRTGAGGILGTSLAARAKPDGNTIVLVANNFSTTPAIRSDLPYDSVKDFAPIALVGYLPYAIVVPANSPSKTLKDLFETARSSKQPITYGTIGVGSHGHFMGRMMEKSTGAPMMQIPFRGQSEMMLGVVGGQVQMGITNLQLSVAQAQDKRVRILATLTEARNPLTPDVPTFAEAGFGRVIENAWYGFLAPSATPATKLDSRRHEIASVLAAPDIRAKLQELGIVPANVRPAQFGELITSEIAKYTRIAREANIKAD